MFKGYASPPLQTYTHGVQKHLPQTRMSWEPCLLDSLLSEVINYSQRAAHQRVHLSLLRRVMAWGPLMRLKLEQKIKTQTRWGPIPHKNWVNRKSHISHIRKEAEKSSNEAKVNIHLLQKTQPAKQKYVWGQYMRRQKKHASMVQVLNDICAIWSKAWNHNKPLKRLRTCRSFLQRSQGKGEQQEIQIPT